MEVRSKPELAVVKFIQALRNEAPRARQTSSRYFEFPLERQLFKAAKRLAKALDLPLRQISGISLFVGERYVTYAFISAEEQWLTAFMPKDGERLLFKTRGVELTVPYVHAYFELYILLHKRMRRRKKSNRNARTNNDFYKAVHYYWKSWRSLVFDSGQPLNPPPDGRWPDVPPFFF